MATQTFPKSYLLERIDARLASLERLDQPDVVTVAAWRNDRDANARQWLTGLGPKMAEMLKAVKAWQAEVARDPNVIREGALELEKLLSFERPYPSLGWNTPEIRRKEEANNAGQRIKLRATERDALTHTRAYLTDTPIEEFSTTMLGRLGLIDAVKFSLDEARAEALAAAKGKRR